MAERKVGLFRVHTQDIGLSEGQQGHDAPASSFAGQRVFIISASDFYLVFTTENGSLLKDRWQMSVLFYTLLILPDNLSLKKQVLINPAAIWLLGALPWRLVALGACLSWYLPSVKPCRRTREEVMRSIRALRAGREVRLVKEEVYHA